MPLPKKWLAEADSTTGTSASIDKIVLGSVIHVILKFSWHECAIFGGMCLFWRNVLFLEGVLILEECDIFGGM